MTITRRNLVAGLAAGGALSGAVAPSLGRAAASRRFKAVAFDGFPIIDPRPVAALSEQLFPGNGAELSNSWRTRQFEYCWLRTLSGQIRRLPPGHTGSVGVCGELATARPECEHA